MAFTQAQLATLEAAYAKGVLSVKDGERTVTYASMSELAAAIERIRAEVATTTRRTKVFRPQYGKGL